TWQPHTAEIAPIARTEQGNETLRGLLLPPVLPLFRHLRRYYGAPMPPKGDSPSRVCPLTIPVYSQYRVSGNRYVIIAHSVGYMRCNFRSLPPPHVPRGDAAQHSRECRATVIMGERISSGPTLRQTDEMDSDTDHYTGIVVIHGIGN